MICLFREASERTPPDSIRQAFRSGALPWCFLQVQGDGTDRATATRENVMPSASALFPQEARAGRTVGRHGVPSPYLRGKHRGGPETKVLYNKSAWSFLGAKHFLTV